MDLRLRGGPPGQRQRRARAVALERVEVGEVLAQDRRGARAVDRRAVAGDDHRRLLDERLEAPQRRAVGVREPPAESIGISTGER